MYSVLLDAMVQRIFNAYTVKESCLLISLIFYVVSQCFLWFGWKVKLQFLFGINEVFVRNQQPKPDQSDWLKEKLNVNQMQNPVGFTNICSDYLHKPPRTWSKQVKYILKPRQMQENLNKPGKSSKASWKPIRHSKPHHSWSNLRQQNNAYRFTHAEAQWYPLKTTRSHSQVVKYRCLDMPCAKKGTIWRLYQNSNVNPSNIRRSEQLMRCYVQESLRGYGCSLWMGQTNSFSPRWLLVVSSMTPKNNHDVFLGLTQ